MPTRSSIRSSFTRFEIACPQKTYTTKTTVRGGSAYAPRSFTGCHRTAGDIFSNAKSITDR